MCNSWSGVHPGRSLSRGPPTDVEARGTELEVSLTPTPRGSRLRLFHARLDLLRHHEEVAEHLRRPVPTPTNTVAPGPRRRSLSPDASFARDRSKPSSTRVSLSRRADPWQVPRDRRRFRTRPGPADRASPSFAPSTRTRVTERDQESQPHERQSDAPQSRGRQQSHESHRHILEHSRRGRDIVQLRVPILERRPDASLLDRHRRQVDKVETSTSAQYESYCPGSERSVCLALCHTSSVGAHVRSPPRADSVDHGSTAPHRAFAGDGATLQFSYLKRANEEGPATPPTGDHTHRRGNMWHCRMAIPEMAPASRHVHSHWLRGSGGPTHSQRSLLLKSHPLKRTWCPAGGPRRRTPSTGGDARHAYEAAGALRTGRGRVFNVGRAAKVTLPGPSSTFAPWAPRGRGRGSSGSSIVVGAPV